MVMSENEDVSRSSASNKRKLLKRKVRDARRNRIRTHGVKKLGSALNNGKDGNSDAGASQDIDCEFSECCLTFVDEYLTASRRR